MRRLWCVLIFVVAVLLGMVRAAEPEGLATQLIEETGVDRGICAIPRCSEPGMAVSMAEGGDFLVHCQAPDSESVADVQRAASEAGLLGKNIIVEKGTVASLPYADNMIDLLVVTDLREDELPGLPVDELLRVVRPGGKVVLGRASKTGDGLSPRALRKRLARAGAKGFEVRADETGVWAQITASRPEGTDDWRHWAHGPDNNPYSEDTVIKAPYRSQWLGKPYYVAMPVVTTIAGGRTFVATGHIAHHDREIPTLTHLYARNGYNGTLLWERDLPEGYMVHRSAFIATEDTFYLMDGDGCLLLDARTGREKGRVGLDGVGGDWKWMALKDGVLYVMAGGKTAPAKRTLVHRQTGHWGWNDLSPGYYEHPVPWGFGNTLAAYDLAKDEVVWKHTADSRIDSRGLGMSGGRLFFHAPGSQVGCLDAGSGVVTWINDDSAVLEAIQSRGKRLLSTPGFRSTSIVLCTPEVVFFEAQTRNFIVALSAQDGSLMWRRERTRNNSNLLYADGTLFSQIGKSGTTTALDPLTGETVEDLEFRKRCCTRMTGCPDSLFCRGGQGGLHGSWGGGEGFGRWDRAEGRYVTDGSLRPGCNDGALPANGLLYVGPWLCDCNLSIMGTVALSSADVDGGPEPDPAEERLERGPGGLNDVASIQVTEADWPTYRANVHRTAGTKAAVPGKVTKRWTWSPDFETRPSPLTTVANLMFMGAEDGIVKCVDLRTGETRWEYATAGPILMPPTVWQGRVLVGSGDGYVYALVADTGKLLWRFRAAPIERRIMAYGSLCSTWPVNSGVLVSSNDGL